MQPEEPVILTPAQKLAVRRYRRLWISRQDLSEAIAAIELIEISGLKRASRGDHPLDLIILTTALMVSYARPFVDTRGKDELADRTLPGSFLRTLTRPQRELHDHMIYMRQKEIAHSDADAIGLTFRLSPTSESSISRTARDPLYRKDLQSLRVIIRKIERQIDRTCLALAKTLPHDTWL